MTNRPLFPLRLKIAQALLYPGLLGIIVEFLTDTHWLLPGSFAIAVSGALLGLTRPTCPRCGLTRTSICETNPQCEVCKHSFYDSMTAHRNESV